MNGFVGLPELAASIVLHRYLNAAEGALDGRVLTYFEDDTLHLLEDAAVANALRVVAQSLGFDVKLVVPV